MASDNVQDQKRAWSTPIVRRIDAGSAEAGGNSKRDEGGVTKGLKS